MTTNREAQRVLTMVDLVLLNEVTSTCEGNARVARVIPSGGVVFGTARHVVRDPETAGFPGRNDDVRDCFLRVTSDIGFEHFWPISELIQDWSQGLFCRYDG